MRPRQGGGLFAVYAAASLLPVLALGVVLALQAATQADARGLSRATSEAALVAEGQIAPLFGDSLVTSGMSPQQRASLGTSVATAVRDKQVLRLRLRDLDANVVFASDGSTTLEKDHALEAAHGTLVAELSTLDADNGLKGPRVAEVYAPLTSTVSGRRIGVVEMYLPYAPIALDLTQQRDAQLKTLSLGLLLLWLILLAVTASTTRRLRRSAQDNAFLATHDVLTGLPNRAEFLALAGRAVESGPCAVAIFDLDRFKEVNDALGHGIGDRLLLALAGRLDELAAHGSVVARLGGDEFGVIFRGGDESDAERQLAALRDALSEPVVLDSLPIGAEAAVGFALAPLDGTDPEDLLAKAEVAMYAAKHSHLGPTRHHPGLDQYDETRLRLLSELGTAIRSNELVLHYQPKSDPATGRITSVEALVRWQHPERGLLYPAAFLPPAEQTGLIDALTRWVVAEALRGVQRLDPSGALSVAVNVSARNLVRPGFAVEVLTALATAQVPPARLIVELTETALLTDPDRAAEALWHLSRAGVRVSIDDFGAGQTSLGYLARLPVYELKIDRAFVQHMDTDARSAAIVRAVIELGHSLGYAVTAEGVETGEVLTMLAAAGCDLVQGFFLARPGPETAIAALITRRVSAL
jgi:diguanylate cyclase (GGDEF)-like protein